METKINISEILRYKPQGTKLYVQLKMWRVKIWEIVE